MGASTTEVLHEAGATRGLHRVIGVDEHAVCTWPTAEDAVALHGLNRRRPRAPRQDEAADEILLRKARTWRSVSTGEVRATAGGAMRSRRRARRARACRVSVRRRGLTGVQRECCPRAGCPRRSVFDPGSRGIRSQLTFVCSLTGPAAHGTAASDPKACPAPNIALQHRAESALQRRGRTTERAPCLGAALARPARPPRGPGASLRTTGRTAAAMWLLRRAPRRVVTAISQGRAWRPETDLSITHAPRESHHFISSTNVGFH